MADAPYTLDSLQLSGFRAYLIPKTFDFGIKRSLAVFAPNGSGKSSIVDALEFMLSEDGTLERLGVRTIDNNAGVAALAHNLAAEKKIDPLVGVRFKCGDKKTEGSRNAVGLTRPRPAVADTVQACFIVNPLVRGHALRQFVEEQTAAKRYEDVARWLQLGAYVDVQRNLRALRQRTKAAADDHSALKRVDTQLTKETANSVGAWDEAAVLAYANSILALLDKELSLNSLRPTDPVFTTVQGRAKAEEKQLGLEGLRQVRRTAAILYEEKGDPDGGGTLTTGLLIDFAAAVDAHADATTAESAERNAAANAAFAELWRIAEPLFAEGKPTLETCPICTTSIVLSAARSAEGVRQHIAARRADLADYAKSKKVLDDAKATVDKAHARLRGALETLAPLLSEAHVVLKVELAAYLEAAKLWNGGTVPDAATLKASLHELVKALDASVAEIEAKQGENTYVKALSKLEDLLELTEERERAVRTLAELEKLATELNTQAAFVSGAIRQEVQALLDTLQVPINDIYREIQGAGAAPIRLELPSEEDTNQQRLNLVIDFAANRAGVQPGGFLSDSQIHSLALALRLAAIKRFNTAAPIIALDDIVTSYDADHRRRIAALLAKEFSAFQLIITTHDERFFTYLKDQLGDGDWHFTRIIRLDPDFGPRFVDHRVTDAMIEARWHEGESAANEMRQAEEEWLLRLCRDFGVNIRIRSVDRAYSYERGELASALAGFLRDRGLAPPVVPGVNNRFLASLHQGAVENFGSHFQDGPYGDGSMGDEKARWEEFKFFRVKFACPKCGKTRFKRPIEMTKAVCASEGCEAQFEFGQPGSSAVQCV
jgi:recombinational DNA repair ATPase RecF